MSSARRSWAGLTIAFSRQISWGSGGPSAQVRLALCCYKLGSGADFERPSSSRQSFVVIGYRPMASLSTTDLVVDRILTTGLFGGLTMFGLAYRFPGSERAYVAPSLTHLASSRLVRTSVASTRSHPFIVRPRISMG